MLHTTHPSFCHTAIHLIRSKASCIHLRSPPHVLCSRVHIPPPPGLLLSLSAPALKVDAPYSAGVPVPHPYLHVEACAWQQAFLWGSRHQSSHASLLTERSRCCVFSLGHVTSSRPALKPSLWLVLSTSVLVLWWLLHFGVEILDLGLGSPPSLVLCASS